MAVVWLVLIQYNLYGIRKRTIVDKSDIFLYDGKLFTLQDLQS